MINHYYIMIIQAVSLIFIYQQVSSTKLTLKDMALIFVIRFAMHIFHNSSLIFTYLLLLFYFDYFKNRGKNVSLSIFFSLYSLTFLIVATNIANSLILQYLHGDVFFEDWMLVVPLLMNYMLLIFLKPNFKFLRQYYSDFNTFFIVLINILLLFICLFQVLTLSRTGHYPLMGTRLYNVAVFFILIIIIFLCFLKFKINTLYREKVASQNEQDLKNILTYVKQVEELYTEISFIRHDFVNILRVLDQAIVDEDLLKAKHIYDATLRQLGKNLQEDRFDLIKLSHIEIDSVKSLLAAKLIEAQKQGVNIHIEVPYPVEDIYTNLLDYIRILSIFMDNAIEATKQEDASQVVYLAMINDPDNLSHDLIIDNISQPSVDKLKIKDIYKKGFSTKGIQRGQGLSIVKDIMASHANMILDTEIKGDRFVQKLTIIKELD